MNRLTRLFSRHLSTKLVLTMLLMIVLSIAVTSYLYYQDSTRIIAGNVRESTQQSAKQSADYLSLILTVGSDMSQQVFRDATIQKVIQEEASGNLTVDQKYEMNATVDQILNNLMYTNSFIRNIYLLKEQGNNWGSGLFNTSKVRRYTLNEHEWYTSVVNNQADELWLPLQLDPFSGGGENTELVLTYVKPLRNLRTMETIGAIVINLDGNVILQAIDRIRLGRTGKFFIINNKDQMMIDPGPEQWSQQILDSAQWQQMRQMNRMEPEFELDIDGTRYYVVTRLMKQDWMIVGGVPAAEVIGDIQKIQHKIWMYAVILLLFASVISWLFSRRITSPLKQLMKQMAQLEKSNFTVLTKVTSRDEVGQLSNKFNSMVKQIERLIQQVNMVESKKREAEMRALRHQINPHFLYNTLSTIRWMVKFKQYEGAYNGIAALVQLMEAGMEKKGPFISIEDELDLLDKYMTIQKFRYGPNLKLQITCDDSLKAVQIPRMLLQPIVENAVFHGIAPKEDGGAIRISIAASTIREQTILITIEDDGVGIPEGRLASLLKPSDQPNSGMFGIGLNHVHETLQLYYGPESGVTISSKPGQGSAIRLQLFMKGGRIHAV
ncbi:sensor histidine kinase [Paenibacillaceae bacterium]|nr:sensor histidine kinase [Paenibacillaceae bacterium]